MSDQFPTYFKATRLDGTDFHTGRVHYDVGKRIRPERHEGAPTICGPGFLHAADVPAMTLVGGSWPCRLFEVTGHVAVGFNEAHAHKGGFKQLTVTRELDPCLALGPNGRYVAGVIERSKRLTLDEAREMRAAWDAARDAAWDAAWDAGRAAAWVAAWDAARDAARDAAWDAAWDAGRAAAWAAAGLIVCDLITPEHFNLLYGPWAAVIGSPEDMLRELDRKDGKS